MDDKYIVTRHTVDGETVYVRLRQRYQTELEVSVSRRNLADTPAQRQVEEMTAVGIHTYKVYSRDGYTIHTKDWAAKEVQFRIPRTSTVEEYAKSLARLCAKIFVEDGQNFKNSLDRIRKDSAARKAEGSAEPRDDKSVIYDAMVLVYDHGQKHDAGITREVSYRGHKYFVRLESAPSRIIVRVTEHRLDARLRSTSAAGVKFDMNRHGLVTWAKPRGGGWGHAAVPAQGTPQAYLDALVRTCVVLYVNEAAADSDYLAEELKDLS